MDYSIALITPEFAREITTWTYDPPYDRYDMSVDNLQGLLNRDYRYHVVFNGDQTLLGFCCFGEDARVPGGTYSIIEPDILDVGVGIHPEFTPISRTQSLPQPGIRTHCPILRDTGRLARRAQEGRLAYGATPIARNPGPGEGSARA